MSKIQANGPFRCRIGSTANSTRNKQVVIFSCFGIQYGLLSPQTLALALTDLAGRRLHNPRTCEYP